MTALTSIRTAWGASVVRSNCWKGSLDSKMTTDGPTAQCQADGLRVTHWHHHRLDADLGAKVLGDSLAKQCVLVEDHDRVLRFVRHGLPLPGST